MYSIEIRINLLNVEERTFLNKFAILDQRHFVDFYRHFDRQTVREQ